MITRRKLLGNVGYGVAAGALAGSFLPLPAFAAAGLSNLDAMKADIAALEKKAGGRLGVALLDPATGAAMEWRGDERFAMCSTFKFLASSFILSRVDAGKERLDRAIPVTKADLVPWAPLTEPHIGGTMTIAALCEAAMIQSDNMAANLLLDQSGGPAGLTAYLRHLGDQTTRLDRNEPKMNNVPENDPRDTTTPLSMLGLMRTILLGDALSAASRERLTGWMLNNKTGDTRLRAGLPGGWRIGDKTGGSDEASNDIAILWPPGGGGPLLLTSYYINGKVPTAQRNAVHADVARLVAGAWAG